MTIPEEVVLTVGTNFQLLKLEAIVSEVLNTVVSDGVVAVILANPALQTIFSDVAWIARVTDDLVSIVEACPAMGAPFAGNEASGARLLNIRRPNERRDIFSRRDAHVALTSRSIRGISESTCSTVRLLVALVTF